MAPFTTNAVGALNECFVDDEASAAACPDDYTEDGIRFLTRPINRLGKGKQFASLARRTSRANAVLISSASAFPFIQTELELRSKPVLGEIDPGVPMPIEAVPAMAFSAAETKPAITLMVAI